MTPISGRMTRLRLNRQLNAHAALLVLGLLALLGRMTRLRLNRQLSAYLRTYDTQCLFKDVGHACA
jgi:hypothetical protein